MQKIDNSKKRKCKVNFYFTSLLKTLKNKACEGIDFFK